MKYTTPSGKLIQVATQILGRGGEGAILPVVGMPHLVAKIYHQPTREHQAKLEYMVS